MAAAPFTTSSLRLITAPLKRFRLVPNVARPPPSHRHRHPCSRLGRLPILRRKGVLLPSAHGHFQLVPAPRDPPPPLAYPPPPGPPPAAPGPSADAFDISGTSVASLQNFLEPTPDVTCREALFFLLPQCHGLAPKKLDEMLVANGWEVQQVQVAGLADLELKLAVRMFTVEQPYPLYRSFNNPFFDKVPPLLPPVCLSP